MEEQGQGPGNLLQSLEARTYDPYEMKPCPPMELARFNDQHPIEMSVEQPPLEMDSSRAIGEMADAHYMVVSPLSPSENSEGMSERLPFISSRINSLG